MDKYGVIYGVIYGVNGPVVKASGCVGFGMNEMVAVGDNKLIGEVISMTSEICIIQVFEDTAGLRPGQKVYGTGKPLSVRLGPGIVGNIFDGIQRPLRTLEAISGSFLGKGIRAASLDEEKLWDTKLHVAIGDAVSQGQVLAEVQETSMIQHRVMVPFGVSGTVATVVSDGAYRVVDVICTIRDAQGGLHNVTMVHEWPIRVPRPVARKRAVDRPLITGQRVIDTLFPIAKGGMAALPGGFGTGKTMTQHQFAKWSDADLIVYIGCGERGNEMTQVLEDFSVLKDPRTGHALMDRTVLIANTSNMPVAAREASIYTGITLAEYYRDMGLHVAIMADSTSRWAEALRELSGRLEEMPAEEGFPAYLASKLAGFYERAGFVDTLSGQEGSVTIIGAVSPQGADFSEPVTQNTKRFVRCFWTLDRNLAYARHFPAIQWLTSYSEYVDDLTPWLTENVGQDFIRHRSEILRILNDESALMEIVKLIGADVLPDEQKLTLEIARVIRLGFVQQNAYHAFDTYVPFGKQMKMMEVILHLNEVCRKLIAENRPMRVLKVESIFDDVIGIKYNVANDKLDEIDDYFGMIGAFDARIREQS